jgi:hypothetical protein
MVGLRRLGVCGPDGERGGHFPHHPTARRVCRSRPWQRYGSRRSRFGRLPCQRPSARRSPHAAGGNWRLGLDVSKGD